MLLYRLRMLYRGDWWEVLITLEERWNIRGVVESFILYTFHSRDWGERGTPTKMSGVLAEESNRTSPENMRELSPLQSVWSACDLKYQGQSGCPQIKFWLQKEIVSYEAAFKFTQEECYTPCLYFGCYAVFVGSRTGCWGCSDNPVSLAKKFLIQFWNEKYIQNFIYGTQIKQTSCGTYTQTGG